VEGQKVEKVKLVEIDRVKEWEAEKILNKSKRSCKVLGILEEVYSITSFLLTTILYGSI